MNSDQIVGNWKKITGEVKKKWGKLTDNEITKAEGRADILAGKIQEHYGKSREEALKEVNEFFLGLKP
jgi:uncharacterized protein YjbJ (UPF0337 family)